MKITTTNLGAWLHRLMLAAIAIHERILPR